MAKLQYENIYRPGPPLVARNRYICVPAHVAERVNISQYGTSKTMTAVVLRNTYRSGLMPRLITIVLAHGVSYK